MRYVFDAEDVKVFVFGACLGEHRGVAEAGPVLSIIGNATIDLLVGVIEVVLVVEVLAFAVEKIEFLAVDILELVHFVPENS